MPAKSAKQQRFLGADLERARSGQKTKTDLSASKLAEMAEKPKRKPKGYGK
ncbi:MAG TPA: hypothetical protein VIL10_05425 [Marmoricola sp.]